MGSKEFSRNDWYKAFIKIHSTFEIHKCRIIKPNTNNLESEEIPNIDLEQYK